MAGGAQLSVPDMRRAARHPVDYPVIGEHRTIGDIKLHIANLSAHGFMVDGVGAETPAFGRGDRVIIRLDDFVAMIEELQPNPRLRRKG